jgi:hypothetical protein
VNEEERTVIIPRGMVIVSEDDPVRVRLEWRTGLVRLKLQRQEEEGHGTKKEEGK